MKVSAIVAVAAIATALPEGLCAPAEKPAFFAYRSFWPEFEAMAQFKEAGVNTVCIFAANTHNSLGQPYSKYPPVWRWFGKYDFASLDRQYDDVIERNPDADFICMIDLNTPIWLGRQLALAGHSAECESFTMLSCACANPAWRKPTAEYLEAVVRHMEERYGSRVKAYLLACGQTDEWMDYSRGIAGREKARAWREWLSAHDRAEVPVPSPERIDRASFQNLIRDPATEGDVIDYARFTGDTIADTILEFSAKTRSLIPGDRQIGVFFGYILELAASRLVWSGHLEYERLYASPNIDFFVSPGTYADRPMGGGSGFMVPNGTRLLHGKGFLHEIDHRTPTYNVNLDEFVSIGWMVPWKNQPEVNAGLKREFALATVHQTSLWCFDMWGGVFETPETMRLVRKAKALWQQFVTPPSKTRAEVALIVDPQSTRYLNDRNPIVPQIYQGTRNKLNRIGAPFEVFSFNDLISADLDRYRLFVFPALFEITPERMQVLNDRVLRGDRSVILAYAPGVSDGNDLDPERVGHLAGAPFGTPDVTTTQHDGWKSIYVHRYEDITPQMLRDAASKAGVNLYLDESAAVFANERLLAVHVANGGTKTISLPTECARARELFTDRSIPVSNKKFQYEFATPDTALFELIP